MISDEKWVDAEGDAGGETTVPVEVAERLRESVVCWSCPVLSGAPPLGSEIFTAVRDRLGQGELVAWPGGAWRRRTESTPHPREGEDGAACSDRSWRSLVGAIHPAKRAGDHPLQRVLVV